MSKKRRILGTGLGIVTSLFWLMPYENVNPSLDLRLLGVILTVILAWECFDSIQEVHSVTN